MNKTTPTRTSFVRPIEYLQVAAYYATNLTSPIGLARALLPIIASTLGETEVSQQGTGLTATIRDNRLLSSAWSLNDANEATMSETRVHLIDRLSADDMTVADSAIWHLIIVKERRGATLRYWDWQWTFTYIRGEAYPHWRQDAHTRLSIRTTYFSNDPEKARPRKFIDEVVRQLVQAGNLYYLVVQPADYIDDGAGLAYEHGGVNGGLSAQITQELWDKLREKRREKVRGVFWGQYLSPWHLERLGGKEQFKKEYQELTKGRPGSERFVTDFPDAGLFIKLCDSPMNFSIFGLNIPCHDFGAWLHERFRDAGLLL